MMEIRYTYLQLSLIPKANVILTLLIILYIIAGIIISAWRLTEIYMTYTDKEFKWWTVPKTILYCLVIAPAYLLYAIISILIKDYLLKRKAKP